jgi:D-alanyl-D-alanine carboxypeptidase
VGNVLLGQRFRSAPMDAPTRSSGSQNRSAAIDVFPLVPVLRSFRTTAVCLSLAALPLTAGAAAHSRPPARCDAPHKYVGPPVASPTEDVFSAELTKPIDGSLPEGLRNALDKAMDEMIAASKATGIQATVAIPGQGIWSGARGFDTAARTRPLTVDDRLQAGSIGKVLTAALVWQLIDEGKLSLDDRVSRWIPAAPNPRALTVGHLLAHTGGVISFNALPSFRDDAGPRSPDELMKLAFAEAPLFCPGATLNYSNTGYVMLGHIIEQIRNVPLDVAITSYAIDRLGLKHSLAQSIARPNANTVSGHAKGQPTSDRVHYGTPHGAGLLASTSEDLVRMLHGLLAGRLVPAPRVRAMLTPLLPMDATNLQFYGRGLMRTSTPPASTGNGGDAGASVNAAPQVTFYGHHGGIVGFRAFAAAVPASRVYVAAMINDDVSAEAAVFKLLQAVTRQLSK